MFLDPARRGRQRPPREGSELVFLVRAGSFFDRERLRVDGRVVVAEHDEVVAAALHERYVGAILDGLTFRVWFHWPTAHEGLPPKLDDYHRPGQSLSEP